MTVHTSGETTGTKLEDLKVPSFGAGDERRAELIKQAEIAKSMETKQAFRSEVCKIAADDFVLNLIDPEVTTVANYKRWSRRAEMLAMEIREERAG